MPSVIFGKGFAECILAFAECLRHSAKKLNPVVKGTDDIGRSLDKCAREFGVPFKFHAITAKWETICIDDLKTEADEVLVVIDLFSLVS